MGRLPYLCTGSDDELMTAQESSFDGAGYVQLPPMTRSGGLRGAVHVELWVRTFDSDALLFLVANDEKVGLRYWPAPMVVS